MNLRPISLFLVFCLVASLGCGSGATTDPEVASPNVFALESVAVGVAQLKALNASIKAAFDAGTPHECDGALHEASEIVNALPQAATDEGFTAEGVETVSKNAKNLFDHYMKIHEGFHGGGEDTSETNSYESVADGIDAAIAELEGVKAG